MSKSGALSIFENRTTTFTAGAKAELAGLMRVGQVTTATSSTIFESTDLIGQDDDAFNGWYVSVLQADNAAPEGEMQPMSDYESATGKVTHTAFTQQLAVGDWVVLLRPEIAMLGKVDTSAATGAVTSTDFMMAYVKQLVTEGITRDTAIGNIPTTMVGTNSAALLVDLGVQSTAAATGAVTTADEVMAYVKQLVTNSRRVVHRMVFWSEIDDLITLNLTAANEVLPSVVVAEIPIGAVILRVNTILSIGSFEDTSTAENSVVLSAAEHIQVKETAGGTFQDAIKMIAGMWLTGASAVRGGLVMIGDIDVASEVDANDTYELQIENADVTGASLLLRDVQTGLIVYFTLE